MPFSSMPVETFGGVNFNDPTDVGWTGAVDLKNVLVEGDRVRTRDGYSEAASIASTGSTSFDHLATMPDGHTVIGGYTDASLVKAVVFTGTPTTNTVSGQVRSCVGYASPTETHAYFVTAGGSQYRYNLTTSTWTDVSASLPNGLKIASWETRLVVADDSSNPSRVYFSGAGTPTTFGADDFVDLPTSAIVQMVQWNNQLYVAGARSLHVFYGVSTDSTGGAVFNYRSLSLSGTAHAMSASPNGVFIVTANGVYRTTGGGLEKLSGALDRWFAGITPSTWTGRTIGAATVFSASVCASSRRLYVRVNSGTSTRCQFVMDFVTGVWTYWELPTLYMTVAYTAANFNTERDELYFGGVATSAAAKLYSMPEDTASALTTDNGSAIASHYQSGRVRLANGQQADVRDFDVYGTGTVTLALAADGGSVNATANGDGTVGGAVSTALASGLNAVNTGALCRDLSFKLSATSGAWSVDALAARGQGARDWT